MIRVELWFGILVKRLINRENFTLKMDLKQKIETFIDDFNNIMTQPFKCTYEGRLLTV